MNTDYSIVADQDTYSEANKAWTIYVLRCADGSFYTGITVDLTRRIRQHNGELAGGARYTRYRRSVSLVWSHQVASRSEAQRIEAHIKALTRADKSHLIDGRLPLAKVTKPVVD